MTELLIDGDQAPKDNLVKVLEIPEYSPQIPLLTWDKWTKDANDKFKHWVEEDKSQVSWPPKLPNLPDELKDIWFEIPGRHGGFLKESEFFRREVGDKSDKVLYRPGIGFGGVLYEFLQKIGTFRRMIVTDPVYEEKEMIEWSEGILPINYWTRLLKTLDPEQMGVYVSKDLKDQGEKVNPEDYILARIPKGGKALIDLKINGVDITVDLLTEDMTKFIPSRFDILSLGRPTPMTSDTSEPRQDPGFRPLVLKHLKDGGLIDFSQGNFNFMSVVLPQEVFGLKVIKKEKDSIVAKKVEDIGRRLEKTYHAVDDIYEALGAIAGNIPGESWAGYFSYRKDTTLDNLVDAYKEHLEKISSFIETLPQSLQETVLDRINFLFMEPLATNGKLDVNKIVDIASTPENPDMPHKRSNNQSSWPYFGDPSYLIREHNEGKIDVVDYYGKLVSAFYEVFSIDEE